MKILVTGAGGFVGHKLMEMCGNAVPSPSLRNMTEDDIRHLIDSINPEVIIHTAAISDMNACESDPDASYLANVIIPTYLAKASSGRKLICFSTDQVYNACIGEGPYTEEDANPGNTYARHKFEMEQRVLDILPSSVMLRAEWMYDYNSPRINYLKLILESDQLTFSSSQYRGITYLREVAENMDKVTTLPGGIYNFGSETDKSMYEITSEFLGYLGKDLHLEDRPNGRNLWMDCSKARKYGITFSSVSEGLKRCVDDYDLKGRAGVSVFEQDKSKWLTTKGSRIVDNSGKEVWLKGINWFGINTGDNALGGLDKCNLEDMIREISERGFNFMRIPVSCEILLKWMNGIFPAPQVDPSVNPELKNKTSLEVFDITLELLRRYGIKVMVDIHSTETDLSGHVYPLWYTENINEDRYLEALTWIAGRYKDNDTVIAYDIKNEPHGRAEEPLHAIWNDSGSRNNWKRFAEVAANTVLDQNPNTLVVIEGIQIYPIDITANNFTSSDHSDYHNTWWGGNLMGVRDHPINLGSPERNRQIVYSVHEYGPTVFMQPWFEEDYSYESLKKDVWDGLWLYLVENNTAPVLIGEWGGFMDDTTLKWMKCIKRLIKDYRLNSAFWCLNPASPDTGGLLRDDFRTWDEEKYGFIKDLLDMD